MLLRLSVLAVLALSGCATPTPLSPIEFLFPPLGSVLEPPTDHDLKNDGSAWAQSNLWVRYSVHWNYGTVQVGKAVRRRNVIMGTTPSMHPDVVRYLASDPEAVKALPNLEEYRRIQRVNTAVLALSGAATAVVLFAYLSAMAGAAALAWGLAGGPNLRDPNALLEPKPYGVIWGSVLGVPPLLLLLVAPASIAQLAAGADAAHVKAAEQRAVNIFNQNLKARIHRNARPAASDKSPSSGVPRSPDGPNQIFTLRFAEEVGRSVLGADGAGCPWSPWLHCGHVRWSAGTPGMAGLPYFSVSFPRGAQSY